VPGVARWLCEQGKPYIGGFHYLYILTVISPLAQARTFRTVQSEIPSRNASMDAVLSEFAVECGPHCAHIDAFGATERLEYTCPATTGCHFSTSSESV
jgi:hypothetical protein